LEELSEEKNMAATNYTPIQLYYSTTASAAPTSGNLANGELAINITDGKLYYKDNGGVVQVIATKGSGTIGGSTTQIQYNNAGALAGSAAMTFNSGTNTTTLTTLNLTNALGATYGGTAQSAYTQGDILYASATNTLSKLAVGTVNYILTSTGSVPQWVAPTSVTVNTATNLAGGAAGSVPYQSGAATTTFLAIGAADRVMTSSGTAPQWVTALTGLTGVSSSSITNTSLTAGRVVYSSTAGLETDSANLTFNGTTLSTAGLSNTGFSTLVKTLTLGDSNFNGTAVFAPATPAKMYFGTGTVTDVTSAASATNVAGAVVAMGITPIAATNASVTYTNASTLYIAGAPSAGTNVTITNPYSLYIAAGASYLGGNTAVTGTLSVTYPASTKAGAVFGTGATTQQGWSLGNLASATSGIWSTADTPSTTNYRLWADANYTIQNGPTYSALGVAGSNVAVASSTGLAVTGALNVSGTIFKPASTFVQWNSTGASGGTNYGIIYADSGSTLYLGAGAGNSMVAAANPNGFSVGSTTAVQYKGQLQVSGPGNDIVVGNATRVGGNSNTAFIDCNSWYDQGTATGKYLVNGYYGQIAFDLAGGYFTIKTLNTLGTAGTNISGTPVQAFAVSKTQQVALGNVSFSAIGTTTTSSLSFDSGGTSYATIKVADGTSGSTDARLLFGNGNSSYGALRMVFNSTANVSVDAVTWGSSASEINLVFQGNGGNTGFGGQTSPSYKVDIRDNARIQGTSATFWMDATYTTGQSYRWIVPDNTYGAPFGSLALYTDTQGAYRLVITKNGNVGIANTNPDAGGKFVVNSPQRNDGGTNTLGAIVAAGPISSAPSNSFASTTAIVRVQGSDATNNLQIGVGAVAYNFHPWIQASFDNATSFGGSGSGTKDLMLQPIGGSVLIGGAVTPTYASGGTTYTNVLVVDASINSFTNGVYFKYNNSGAFFTLNNTYGSSTRYFLTFDNGNTRAGDVTYNGSVMTYGGTSDYRLKENVKPIQNAIQRVMQMNPVSFTWKHNGMEAEGWLAHEIQAIVRDAATGTKDEVNDKGEPVYQQVDPRHVVAVLTKALQEMWTELNNTKEALKSAGVSGF
jgi:hypothetical protein